MLEATLATLFWEPWLVSEQKVLCHSFEVSFIKLNFECAHGLAETFKPWAFTSGLIDYLERTKMLEVSQVNRSLDRKTTILWLELIDIFIIVTATSVLNLLFGRTGLKMYLVYLPSLTLGITMILAKRGKPDNFLFHYLRYQLRPKNLTCFEKGPELYVYSRAIFKKRGQI